MLKFQAKIEIIGVNPYVLLPEEVLQGIFDQAQKSKGPIPVKGKIDGHDFIQTLVKYAGHWRLYLNMPMRDISGTKAGDVADFHLQYDAKPRITPMHPKLQQALDDNEKARAIFDQLNRSHQKEIMRYINHLKSEESVARNVTKAIGYLMGKERFIGRDRP